MKRFKIVSQALLGAIVAAVLSVSAQAVEPTKDEAETIAFEPVVNKVAPITSFELSQLAHHFDLSHDAELLRLIDQAPVEPAERFYAADRRNAESLLSSLTTIEDMHLGEVGVALLNQDGIVLLYSGERFPLMSVMKFHVGYAVLSRMVERGERLRSTISIKLSDLDPDTYSPMYEELERRNFRIDNCAPGGHLAPAINAMLSAYGHACQEGTAEKESYHTWGDLYLQHLNQGSYAIPVGTRLHAMETHPQRVNICLGDLIYYAVRESDNNACDILINYYLGGIDKLEQFWHDKGVTGLKFKYTEAQMAQDPKRCYDNSATPYELAQSYAVYLNDTELPVQLHRFLDDTMLFPPTGTDRIQCGVQRTIAELADSKEQEQALFKTLRIFDKTGTGGLNEAGKRIAVNDLAYINYEGKPYVLAVLVKNIPGTAQSSSEDGARALRKSARVAFTYALNLFHHAGIVTPIDLVRSCSSQ